MLPWKRLLRPLTALLLTAAVAAVPATAAHASSAPTSGWNDYSCKPSAAHPRPVILVHGTFANATDNWLTLAPYLEARGYCVFSLDYGQLPGVPLVYGLGPIDKSAEQLQVYVDKVLAATGAAKADLVGHSQGGMMPRYYLKFLGGAAKVNTFVGIAPDNHGTTLDGLTKLLPYFPGAEDVISAAAPGLADQVSRLRLPRQAERGRRHRPRRPLHGHRHQVRRGRHALHESVPERVRRTQRADPEPVFSGSLRACPARADGPDRLPRGRQRPRSRARHRHHLPVGAQLTVGTPRGLSDLSRRTGPAPCTAT